MAEVFTSHISFLALMTLTQSSLRVRHLRGKKSLRIKYKLAYNHLHDNERAIYKCKSTTW